MSDSADAYDEIKSAIDKIEQKTAKSIAEGLRDLGHALTNLKQALVDCKAAEAEVAKFAKAIEDGFEHPLSFVFHVGKELIVNGRDIYAEITAAVSDWKAQSYRASGVQIGKALSKLLQPSFAAWQLAHGKQYATAADEAAARAAFDLNTDLVRSAHLQSAAGVHYHLNEYADLSPAAFNVRNGLIPSQRPQPTRTHVLSGKSTPTAVDWRKHGLVADVKNQGSCGSCVPTSRTEGPCGSCGSCGPCGESGPCSESGSTGESGLFASYRSPHTAPPPSRAPPLAPSPAVAGHSPRSSRSRGSMPSRRAS